MKIKPIGSNILIKINEAKAGALSLDSMKTAVEVGEVVAVGTYGEVKVGDKIHFKAWACDIIVDEGEKYYYIDMTTGGVKGIIK